MEGGRGYMTSPVPKKRRCGRGPQALSIQADHMSNPLDMMNAMSTQLDMMNVIAPLALAQKRTVQQFVDMLAAG